MGPGVKRRAQKSDLDLLPGRKKGYGALHGVPLWAGVVQSF